jgi:hypothetical protein
MEVILDKGIVIDAFVRVSLIGIEILTIDARIVIASVDTYLRFAEAVNRAERAKDAIKGDDEDDDDDESKCRSRRRSSSSSSRSSSSRSRSGKRSTS